MARRWRWRLRDVPCSHSCTIWYMNATPKDRLLAKVVDVALAGGISDKSLRAIADAAGTSHRMLIHHFGSRDGLLVAVIKAVEAQQRSLLIDTISASDAVAV